MRKDTAMKTTAALFGLLVILIVGWSQREFIGSELGLTAPSGTALQVDTSRIVTRRVWAGAGVDLSGSPSPDGALLSHVDWTTGDLAVRNLTSGESRHVTETGGLPESAEMAYHSVVSRDGRHIAYTWLNRALEWEIRVVRAEGGEERVLVTSPSCAAPGICVRPYDWSPDGRHVLMHMEDATPVSRLGVIALEGGAFRPLATLTDRRRPSRAAFSPDGRFVVFDDHAEADPPQSDIYVIPADGGRRRPLVEHPANDVLLGWSPDGSTILFASDRTGTQAAWLIPVDNGRAAGRPVLVKSDLWRASGLGFARNGAYFYGIDVGSGDVYVASIDVASGRVLTPPTAALRRFLGSNSSPEWSPDGHYLAYVSSRGPGPGWGRVIVIRSLATGDERTIVPDLSSYQEGLRWSPDGRFLVTVGTDRRAIRGIHVIDAQTGATRRIAETPAGGALMSPAWLGNGAAVVYVERSWATSRDRIVKHDIATNQVSELAGWSMEDYWGWMVAASPDGDSIAFPRVDAKTVVPAFYVMSAAGGPEREVARLPAKTYVPWHLSWAPDGRHLIYVTAPAQGRQRQVWAVAASGGEPYRVAIEDVRLNQLRIHPDGRRIAYRAGEDQREVWVMENFLPPAPREE